MAPMTDGSKKPVSNRVNLIRTQAIIDLLYLIVPVFRPYLLLSCHYVTEEFILEKYEDVNLSQ